MNKQSSSYLLIFIILLIILTCIYLLVRSNDNLERKIYEEGIFIDTTMQIDNR